MAGLSAPEMPNVNPFKSNGLAAIFASGGCRQDTADRTLRHDVTLVVSSDGDGELEDPVFLEAAIDRAPRQTESSRDRFFVIVEDRESFQDEILLNCSKRGQRSRSGL